MVCGLLFFTSREAAWSWEGVDPCWQEEDLWLPFCLAFYMFDPCWQEEDLWLLYMS